MVPAPRREPVDAALLAEIQSAGRPVRAPWPPRIPASIPGNDGKLASMHRLIQSIRRGVAKPLEGRARHGDVFRAGFAGRSALMVWDADEVHRILRNEDQAWSTALGWETLQFGGLDPRSGNTGALLSLDFEDHRAARKIVQPAFTMKAIDGYLATANDLFEAEIARWRAKRKVAFKREIRTLLSGVSNAIFTGFTDPREVERVDRALADFWSGMMVLFRSAWLSPTFRRAQRGLATLLEVFTALVPERRRAGGTNLFSRLCAATPAAPGEQASQADDDALVRVFITVMFGAFDTTSAAMTSMGYLLAKHPAWQARLREEARSVGSAPPSASAMKDMKHHEWVWKESLRLMPIAGFIPRRSLREVVIAGNTLPAGSLVLPMSGAMGRHPKWWTAPDTFDPERFSPERAEDKRHPGIFNPFGAGAHACVGMQLANMEMKLFWHRLLSRSRVRLTRDYDAHHTFTPFGVVSGDVALTLEPLGD